MELNIKFEEFKIACQNLVGEQLKIWIVARLLKIAPDKLTPTAAAPYGITQPTIYRCKNYIIQASHKIAALTAINYTPDSSNITIDCTPEDFKYVCNNSSSVQFRLWLVTKILSIPASNLTPVIAKQYNISRSSLYNNKASIDTIMPQKPQPQELYNDMYNYYDEDLAENQHKTHTYASVPYEKLHINHEPRTTNEEYAANNTITTQPRKLSITTTSLI